MKNPKRKKKVGFVVLDGDWLGGRSYLMNLFRALQGLHDGAIETVLLKGKGTPDPSPDFPGVTVVSTPLLDKRSPQWFIRQATKAVSGRDWMLERLLARHGIEVLSHSGHLGRKSSVATIGWIPDFQCFHFPEFFTKSERELRSNWYATMGDKCDRVIVSSETVRQDMLKFLPEYAHKAAVLRFVATAFPEDQSSSVSSLQQKYGLPERYFLLPNQFWAHKNHRVVITALKILKQAGVSIPVYATGRKEDHRNPSFFKSLLQYADDCDVRDCFRILGLVPFADLAGLMRNTVAIINPSQFEGWSTSVEEAKTLGKAVLLSDIPVHREQAPRLGTYFPPSDAEALADSLKLVFNSYDHDVDALNQKLAKEEFCVRQMGFARTFEKIVLDACKS